MANKHLRRMLCSGLVFFPPKRTPEPAYMHGLSYHDCNHAACLPRQANHFLLSSSTTCSSAHIEGECVSNEEERGTLEKQLHRSHSWSKLRGKNLIPASFRSLLQRATSHGHLHGRHGCIENAAENGMSAVSKYARSWSSPSLHVGRRHEIKLPQKAHSFTGSQSKGEGSRKTCARRGHVVVYVEESSERHVVPITYLGHPEFQALLKRAEREYGYRQDGPGLRIPCSVAELHHTLHHIRALTSCFGSPLLMNIS